MAAPERAPGAGEAPSDGRVGPPPGPPPERLDTMTMLDLLATARRWRVRDPFVTGQAEGLTRALIACVNAHEPVPRWLRHALLSYLLEALWDRPRPQRGGASWDETVEALVDRWSED